MSDNKIQFSVEPTLVGNVYTCEGETRISDRDGVILGVFANGRRKVTSRIALEDAENLANSILDAVKRAKAMAEIRDVAMDGPLEGPDRIQRLTSHPDICP